jgi:hypothetical protein
MRRLLVAPVVLAALAAAPGAGGAEPGAPGAHPQATRGDGAARSARLARASARQLLWATVNVCDSPSAPDMLGVRASMPGSGSAGRMYMRFHAEWFSALNQRWLPVGGKSVSPWLSVGSARYESRQAGYTFEIAPPTAGGAFLLRGRVDYRWRAKKALRRGHGTRTTRRRARWVVVRRAHAATTDSLPGQILKGSPPTPSLPLCVVS